MIVAVTTLWTLCNDSNHPPAPPSVPYIVISGALWPRVAVISSHLALYGLAHGVDCSKCPAECSKRHVDCSKHGGVSGGVFKVFDVFEGRLDHRDAPIIRMTVNHPPDSA